MLASGHAEIGNDIPMALSTTSASRVEGGWRMNGRKMFGSLGRTGTGSGSTRWTPATRRPGRRARLRAARRAGPDHRRELGYLGDAGDGEPRHYVRGRVRHRLGRVLRGSGGTTEPSGGGGDAGVGGDAHRQRVRRHRRASAGDRGAPQAGRRRFVAIPRGIFARHPLVQHQVAEMYLALDAARASVDAVARDWVSGVDHGQMWGPKVLAAKWQAMVAANRVMDLGVRGGRRLVVPSRDGAGTAVTGRAGRAVPPGDRRVHPRDDRQGTARRRRGRAPLVTRSRQGRRQ